MGNWGPLAIARDSRHVIVFTTEVEAPSFVLLGPEWSQPSGGGASRVRMVVTRRGASMRCYRVCLLMPDA
jgi:hypothetical protein